MLFADLLSLHLVTFLMFFILVQYLHSSCSRKVVLSLTADQNILLLLLGFRYLKKLDLAVCS